jgi:hypothetical protein
MGMALFKLVEDIAEGTLRFRWSLPFLFAYVFLAKRRNGIGHGGYFSIVAHAWRAAGAAQRGFFRYSVL